MDIYRNLEQTISLHLSYFLLNEHKVSQSRYQKWQVPTVRRCHVASNIHIGRYKKRLMTSKMPKIPNTYVAAILQVYSPFTHATQGRNKKTICENIRLPKQTFQGCCNTFNLCTIVPKGKNTCRKSDQRQTK